MKKTIQAKIIHAENLIAKADATDENIADLERWIGYFQHERAIHLIVTVFVGICEMISVLMLLLFPSPASIALTALIAVLFAFYIAHYYILENGTQKLYRLCDDMRQIARQKASKAAPKAAHPPRQKPAR